MPEPKPQLSGSERLTLTRRLVARAFKYRTAVIIAFVTMVLAGITDSIPAFIVQAFVGLVLNDEGLNEPDKAFSERVTIAAAEAIHPLFPAETDMRLAIGVVVAGSILVLSILTAVATYANEFLAKYLASVVVKDLRVDLLRRIVHLPYAWFHDRKLGDIMSRFSNDTTTTFQTVNVVLSEVLHQPFVIVSSAGVAIWLNWRLALAALIFIPLVILPVLALGRRVHRRSRRTFESLGQTVESTNQVLSGLRVVKAFRMEDLEIQDYEKINQRWLDQQVDLVRAKALGRSLMDIIWGVLVAIVLGAGSYLVVTETWGLQAEDLTAFLVALISIFRPLKRLSVGYNTWQASIAAAGRVFEVLDATVERQDAPGAQTIGAIRKGIRLEDVHFTYDTGEGREAVLVGLNLEIPAGKTVALVGPSGAGKSTIANLLLRFFEPKSGAILIDDVPMTEIRRTSLLDQIALVSQQPFLFNASVRDNIAYGRPGCSDAEVESAARAAHIHLDIAKLPSGYNTVVGERGSTLSGGQLQRITLARALVRNASLLILDEATSSLDAASERAVQEALDEILKGRTALVIAHRLSTIRRADIIAVLEGGRIVEQGDHESLLAKGGLYAHLYRTQSGGARVP